MVAAALAQGLTADMFLQLTTTLAHMSAINNNSNGMPDVTNDSKNNIGGNVTGLKLAKFDNGTFLNLERGHCPKMFVRKLFRYFWGKFCYKLKEKMMQNGSVHGVYLLERNTSTAMQ